MAYEELKLENQLCFPLYVASRLITRAYQPFLDELGITYPQYLVLMILWERGELPVNDIAKKLHLKTSTVTPLLKRMEEQAWLVRKKDSKDQRKVLISLSTKAKSIEAKALCIPRALTQEFDQGPLTLTDAIKLKEDLDKLISAMSS
jgi:DNA-binding MarR family transcriptional regulator